MKFSDVIIAAASLFVISLIIDVFLTVGLVGWNTLWDEPVSVIIAVLATSLVIGYVFALKIQEGSRVGAIWSIVVLNTALLMIFTAAFFAIPTASPAIKDVMQRIFSTSGWTDYDWYAYIALFQIVFMVLSLVLSFIGLYAGSMLRKPKKT